MSRIWMVSVSHILDNWPNNLVIEQWIYPIQFVFFCVYKMEPRRYAFTRYKFGFPVLPLE